MGTIVEKLDYSLDAKAGIRQAIIDKEVDVPEGTPLADYAELIAAIQGGGGSYSGVNNICNMVPHPGYFTSGTSTYGEAACRNFIVPIEPDTYYLLYIKVSGNRFRLTTWAVEPHLGGSALRSLVAVNNPGNGYNYIFKSSSSDKFINIYYTSQNDDAIIYVYELTGIDTGTIGSDNIEHIKF